MFTLAHLAPQAHAAVGSSDNPAWPLPNKTTAITSNFVSRFKKQAQYVYHWITIVMYLILGAEPDAN